MTSRSTIHLTAITILVVCLVETDIYGQQTETIIEEKQALTQTNEPMYGRSGALKAKPGQTDELASILLQAADLVSAVEGCRIYIVGRDLDDETLIWVYEVWDSKENHAKSLQMEEVQTLISKAMPLIDSFPEGGAEMSILGGAGIR